MATGGWTIFCSLQGAASVDCGCLVRFVSQYEKSGWFFSPTFLGGLLPLLGVPSFGQMGVLPDRLHCHRPVKPPGETGQTGWSSLLPILVVNTSHLALRSHILMLYPHKSSLAGCLFLVISVSACPASFLSSYQLPAKLAKIMLLRWEMHAEEPNA